MPHPSGARLLVLHGLRLLGFGSAAAVSGVVGIGADVVDEHLQKLAADDLVVHRDGRLTGWALTPAGRAEHERLLDDELNVAGCRAEVVVAYRQFLELNGDLLTLCTRWQLKDESINDHSDPTYDAKVVANLVDLHNCVLPVLDQLAAVLARYGGYRGRFDIALTHLRGGDPDWFAKPMIDSYHTVWFQLHEDLLATLGLERAHEAPA